MGVTWGTHTLTGAGSGQLLLLTLVPAILGTSLLLTAALMFWIFCRRRRRREDRAISDSATCAVWMPLTLCKFYTLKIRKLQEKLAQSKARKLEHQREMSISTILTVGDYQERYIM